MTNLSLGEKIRKYRRESNLSQEELAQKISVSMRTLQRWEKGSDIKFIELKKIAEALNVHVADFYDALHNDSINEIKKIEEDLRKRLVKSTLVAIPIFGAVPAGNTSLFEEKPGWLTVDERFIKGFKEKDLFCLIAKGNCLKDAGLFDGDQIIVSKTAKAKDGDICVVRIDEEITCKKTYFQDGKIILETMNKDDDKRFIIDPKRKDVEIIGKVVRAIKNFA